MKKIIICASAALSLSGCASLADLHEVHSLASEGSDKGPKIFVTDSNVRNSYVFDKTAVITPSTDGSTSTVTLRDGAAICADPPPDTASQIAEKVTASLKNAKGEDNGLTSEYAQTVVQLAGRTQTVLIARDLLASTCLMRANGFLDNSQVYSLYSQTISLIKDMATTDKNNSTKDALDAVTDAKKANVDAAIVNSIARSGSYDAARAQKVGALAGFIFNMKDDKGIPLTAQAKATKLKKDVGCSADDYYCNSLMDSWAADANLSGLITDIGGAYSPYIDKLYAAYKLGS